MSTSGGSSGGGVSSFNTRTGAVVYDLADAETVYTVAGELLAGSGPGAGDLLGIGTAGQVLTVGGADPSGLEWATPAGGGTGVESYMTANLVMTSAVYNNLTAVSLAAGTWLVIGRGLFNTTTTTIVDMFLGPTSGSNTGAYGAASALLGNVAGNDNDQYLTIARRITLATATDVYLIAHPSASGCTAEALSLFASIGDVTGITAIPCS